MVLAQILGGGDNVIYTIVSVLFLVGFFALYPRLMLMQIMQKLEKSVKELEELSASAKKVVLHEIGSKDKRAKESVDRLFEFFAVFPVDLDPSGILRKLDHTVRGQKARFHEFAAEVAPKADAEKRASLEAGLSWGMEVHMLAKIVRHYLEFIKKTKSFQIAMILQMQLPLVEQIARALYRGTKATAKGEPGKAVEALSRKARISRIITIDAAAKLEGERTGSVAEGVGVAMGGIGVERAAIEQVALAKDIPIDSIVVKMSLEEAIQHLPKAAVDALPEVRAAVSRSLKRAPRQGAVVLIGVGNTSGVGNNGKAAAKAAEWAKKHHAAGQKAKK
ncbi:MAG TPA: DUF1512 family protein [archaeon]|nr:DUF1512 family protein [archaeon]